jgi:hypothetical protein
MTSELQSRPSTRNRAALIPFSIVDELSCYFDTSAEPNNVHIEARAPGQPRGLSVGVIMASGHLQLGSAAGKRCLMKPPHSSSRAVLLRRLQTWRGPLLDPNNAPSERQPPS